MVMSKFFVRNDFSLRSVCKRMVLFWRRSPSQYVDSHFLNSMWYCPCKTGIIDIQGDQLRMRENKRLVFK
ncbi:unnamed protein product [Acanthoscelides obtectus]|uniref:Uncharacterized protein n=1 Tax=Acanthoscelides obtectus TaxID=200917 RepID=A0A9P0LKV4_ACAOB|nr:unnamed protein product [Acanthoscelides obtectus]CAK1658830.1 hypothetical protein AOBTE_LOCUS21150 [Acanthoscelides obtectus]